MSVFSLSRAVFIYVQILSSPVLCRTLPEQFISSILRRNMCPLSWFEFLEHMGVLADVFFAVAMVKPCYDSCFWHCVYSAT